MKRDSIEIGAVACIAIGLFDLLMIATNRAPTVEAGAAMLVIGVGLAVISRRQSEGERP